MRAVVCLLAVLFLAAASSAVAQEKHLIAPMLPGSLNPKPLPPLKNPDAPSTPAKELFARKSTPFGAGALPQSWRRRPFGRRREWPQALFCSAQEIDCRATVARRAAGTRGAGGECLDRQAQRVARACARRRGYSPERTRTR